MRAPRPAAKEIAQHLGQISVIGRRHVLECGAVLPRQNPRFEREARRIRRERDEVIVAQDHARSRSRFPAGSCRRRCSALFRRSSACELSTSSRTRLGTMGKCDQLRMRMFERGSGGFAVVLEKQDIAEAPVVLQIEDAVAIGPENFLDWLVAAW